MFDTEVRLGAAATATAPALVLRPWRPTDAAALTEAYRDPVLRRWVSGDVRDEADAVRWLRVQQEGWASGQRLAFAVLEAHQDGGEGALAGQAVLKAPAGQTVFRAPETPGGPSAEVGYWTAAHARGRSVAPRALSALTDWAFTAFPHLTRLELLHQTANTASCRVAEKSGYALESVLPAAPPDYPGTGHLHVRR
ncbi:GNAT family N-acetyltransferase [Streptomyces sp. NPDC002328]|uniref:GNAT family N-acetyltransferase n=1 Tax=Streptomyces sp. NPDC002328 TaxID=3364642 RepID=UPI0036B8B444